MNVVCWVEILPCGTSLSSKIKYTIDQRTAGWIGQTIANKTSDQTVTKSSAETDRNTRVCFSFSNIFLKKKNLRGGSIRRPLEHAGPPAQVRSLHSYPLRCVTPARWVCSPLGEGSCKSPGSNLTARSRSSDPHSTPPPPLLSLVSTRLAQYEVTTY